VRCVRLPLPFHSTVQRKREATQNKLELLYLAIDLATLYIHLYTYIVGESASTGSPRRSGCALSSASGRSISTLRKSANLICAEQVYASCPLRPLPRNTHVLKTPKCSSPLIQITTYDLKTSGKGAVSHTTDRSAAIQQGKSVIQDVGWVESARPTKFIEIR
jgi:hypothetical protein